MTESGSLLDRLAARIRAEREHQRLTVAELSTRSGVGRATITGLEQAARTPSLETVGKIAAGLAIDVPDLLGEPAASDPLERLDDALGAELLDLRIEGDTQVEVHRLHVTAEVHRDPAHTGARGYLTILAGRLTAGTAGTPRHLGAGEQLAFSLDLPHVYVPEDGPVEAVLVLRYPLPDQPSGDRASRGTTPRTR